MEKRTYKKVMDVPTEMLVTEPVLVDKIKDRVKGEVINGIIGLMSNDNEYIVSLSDIIETQNYSCDFMSRFEQKINLVPLVRCKDCKWKQGSACVRFADVWTFSDDFCSRAERREDE